MPQVHLEVHIASSSCLALSGHYRIFHRHRPDSRAEGSQDLGELVVIYGTEHAEKRYVCVYIYIYTHRLSPILVGSINVHLCDIATPLLLNWAPKFGSSHFRGWNISNITGPKGGIHTVKEPWKMETSSNKTEPCWNNLKASIVLDIPLPSRRSNNLKAPSSLTGKTCAS